MKLFTDEEIAQLEATDPALRPEQAAIEALRSGVGVTLPMVLQARRALTEAKLAASGKSAYLQKSDLKHFAYRSEISEIEEIVGSLQITVYGLYAILIAKNLITEKEYFDILRHGEIVPESAPGVVQ
jgi:hypothetical protein